MLFFPWVCTNTEWCVPNTGSCCVVSCPENALLSTCRSSHCPQPPATTACRAVFTVLLGVHFDILMTTQSQTTRQCSTFLILLQQVTTGSVATPRHIYFPTGWRQKSKTSFTGPESRCGQVLAPSRGPGAEPISLPFQLLEGVPICTTSLFFLQDLVCYLLSSDLPPPTLVGRSDPHRSPYFKFTNLISSAVSFPYK